MAAVRYQMERRPSASLATTPLPPSRRQRQSDPERRLPTSSDWFWDGFCSLASLLTTQLTFRVALEENNSLALEALRLEMAQIFNCLGQYQKATELTQVYLRSHSFFS